jgi:hypothetical protein
LDRVTRRSFAGAATVAERRHDEAHFKTHRLFLIEPPFDAETVK